MKRALIIKELREVVLRCRYKTEHDWVVEKIARIIKRMERSDAAKKARNGH